MCSLPHLRHLVSLELCDDCILDRGVTVDFGMKRTHSPAIRDFASIGVHVHHVFEGGVANAAFMLSDVGSVMEPLAIKAASAWLSSSKYMVVLALAARGLGGVKFQNHTSELQYSLKWKLSFSQKRWPSKPSEMET